MRFVRLTHVDEVENFEMFVSEFFGLKGKECLAFLRLKL